MDISRPDLKAKKRRRQALTIAIGVVLLAGITFLVMRLKPAAPTVDRSVVWTDIVKRGPMVRQVRGLGTLVPREDAIRQIPAQSEATVVRILTLPGSDVKADTVLMELSDPQLSQEALDAELSLRSARADLSNVQVKVQSDLMAQKSTACLLYTSEAACLVVTRVLDKLKSWNAHLVERLVVCGAGVPHADGSDT